VPHKGKLPATLKIHIVEAYLAKEKSSSKILQKYGINNVTYADFAIPNDYECCMHDSGKKCFR
jgi:hypothetical protein